MLILHIIIATFSLIYTGITYMHPTKTKLNVSYTLVAATVATGTVMVLQNHAALTQSCQTGLAYLAVVGVGLFMAHRKLAAEINK